MTEPFVLEVCCCSGGMAEGFRRAGLPVTMAIDYDPDACASYEANMGHAPIRMDARDLLRMARAGWRTERPIDLLIADPPCTPWSRAGKRLGLRDERDMLRVTVELVEVLRPRAYLIANIPGLDDEPNWPVVQETIGGLSRHGYCSADFARLDAADFGVPQHRVRPFWYGHLDGPCVVWPSRTHGSPEECGPTLPGIEPLRPWVTCREALGHLPPNELGKPIKLRRRACNGRQHGSVLERPARTVGTSNRLRRQRAPLREPAVCLAHRRAGAGRDLPRQPPGDDLDDDGGQDHRVAVGCASDDDLD
jgi:site-specific DNA-cytosine methylase